MNLDKIHIFIILLLALICSSCLGSFMREGYENDVKTNVNSDTSSKVLTARRGGKDTYKNYDEFHDDLHRDTVAYSNSKLSKDKKLEGYHDDDDDDEVNNINSYGNLNKYPNVVMNNMLTAGKKRFKNISGSQIAPGSEHLYMLKSEIVPPVCPACPAVTTCPTEKKCPPCPPCARCPEPAFECKKVPNYSGQNDSYLPQPVMSDFSQFGL
jgi:hypothetical protein